MQRHLASLVIAAVAVIGMARAGWFRLLVSAHYLPHRFCYLAQPGLVWTNVTTDTLIAVSYTLLFACILFIVRKLRGVAPLRPYIWIFLSFATFILACGLTHMMEVVTVWWPLYPLSAATKILCALVSIPTAILFARITPIIVTNVAAFFDLLANAQRAVSEAADYRDQIEAINRCQMMIEFNMDGTILRANESVLRRFGYTHEQMAGQDHSIILNNEDKGSERQLEFWRQLRLGKFQSGEYRRIGAAGQEVWVEVRYTPIFGPDNLPHKVVAFATDETERVTARLASEKKIRDTEAHLQAIVDNVLVGILITDRTGRINSINPAAVAMFGYTAQKAVGRKLHTLIPTADALFPDPQPLDSQAGASAAPGIVSELQGLAGDGRNFPVELTVTEIVAEDDKLYVALVRDITQRKLADDIRRRQEEALRKSEDFLERTGKLAGVGGWEVDLATEAVIWSPETCRILGAEPFYQPTLQEAINLYVPEARLVIAAAIAKSAETGEGWDLELAKITRDGRHIWSRTVGTVECLNGKPVRLLGAFQDITTRVAQRLALEEANTRAALATESGGIGIWHRDFKSGRLTCDPWMYRLYGLPPEGDIAFDFDFWKSHIHPEDRPFVEQALAEAIAGPKLYQVEFRIVWDDDSVHFIRAAGRVTLDESGSPASIVGTNMDITERVVQQHALELASTRAALATDSGGIGIWDWDLKTGDMTCDAWMHRLYGLNPELHNLDDYQVWTAYVHPDDRDMVEQVRKTRIETLAPSEVEFRILWDDGSLHFIKGAGKVICDRKGQPVRMVGINTDITARKLIEHQIQHARLDAEQANRAKSDFLANMSHEVRTPVNAILGMAYLALRADPSPKQRDYLTKIDKAANNLLSIMNDILDFSKIEAGKLILESIAFTLEEVLSGVRDIVGYKAEQKRLPMSFHVAPDVPAHLVGDPLRLGQVLINLLNNAVKFTERGQISLTISVVEPATSPDPGKVELRFSVADSGIGMTPPQTAQLFQAFTQADTSFTRQYGGTGLGLALSKQFSELMGGRIWVDSEFGAGSTFHCTAVFANAPSALSEPAPQSMKQPDMPFTTRHILIVDDSEDDQNQLFALLRPQGHSFRAVSSGEQAIAALVAGSQTGRPFDLVFLDWRLPGIDGIETARRIKASKALQQMPAIILLSAFDRAEAMTGAHDVVLEGFFTKPLTAESLTQAIAVTSASPAASLALQPTALDPLAGRRVLLVEDNELNRDLAIELLNDLHLIVTVAVNGRDAVDLVDAQAFDLVLMDIQMPLMDGLTATKLIRADSRFKALPILAMTAHAMSGDRERSLNAGMNDHVTKPIDPDRLKQTLLRWMPAPLPLQPTSLAAPPAPSDDIPAQLPPFDIPAALARTSHKPRLLRKMLLGFRDQYAHAAAELRMHLDEQKLEQAERLAHSLKSVAAMLEARDLAIAAANIETALRTGRTHGLAALISTLETHLVPAIQAASTLDRRTHDKPDELSPLSPDIASPSRKKHSILVVDDEPIILRLFADTFHEYDVYMAKDGEAAIQLATLNHPELILLDVSMPGMDGFEVCRRLKNEARTCDIPIVFVTGYGDMEAETRGLTLGAVDYVTKPMNPAVMRARIANQFKLKRAQVDLLRILAKKYLDDMVDELERSAAQDRTRELQLQMKDNFLSHVSHELRSPLASIYSFVTLVSDRIAGEITPEQDEYLGIALMNVDQLQSMIEDLLESTRMRTGKLSVELEAVSLPEVIDFAVQSLREAAKAKSVNLYACIPDNLTSAHADATRMRQSLTILIDNALKFTPPGGDVIVSVRTFEKNAGFFLVQVADTGCGISPEMTEKIFERLYQVQNPNPVDAGRSGLGLGLHIAQELVRRQGGEIWVESILGQGSTFCFTVPVAPANSNLVADAAA